MAKVITSWGSLGSWSYCMGWKKKYCQQLSWLSQNNLKFSFILKIWSFMWYKKVYRYTCILVKVRLENCQIRYVWISWFCVMIIWWHVVGQNDHTFGYELLGHSQSEVSIFWVQLETVSWSFPDIYWQVRVWWIKMSNLINDDVGQLL